MLTTPTPLVTGRWDDEDLILQSSCAKEPLEGNEEHPEHGDHKEHPKVLLQGLNEGLVRRLPHRLLLQLPRIP